MISVFAHMHYAKERKEGYPAAGTTKHQVDSLTNFQYKYIRTPGHVSRCWTAERHSAHLIYATAVAWPPHAMGRISRTFLQLVLPAFSYRPPPNSAG